LTVQEEIIKETAEQLRPRLTGEEQSLLSKRHTRDSEANRLYLKGIYHYEQSTQDGCQKCIECMKQAIDKDSDYALAYSGLADCYTLLRYYGAPETIQAAPLAKAAALKALELDPNLAEAHVSLGRVAWISDWNWQEAEREFKRALALDSDSEAAHGTYGGYLLAMGRFEQAFAERKRSQELDPLAPGRIANLGDIFYFERRFDEAIDLYRKVIELEPNYAQAHYSLGWCYALKQMYPEGIKEMLSANSLSGEVPIYKASLCWAYARAGKEQEASQLRAELNRFEKKSYVSPYIFAIIHDGFGDYARAIDQLEKAYEQRDYLMIWLKVDVVFSSRLRSNPRFQEIVRRMDFPEK
jgi:adenylate cyclase